MTNIVGKESIKDVLNAGKADPEELTIDAALLEAVDLSLPPEYEAELMATELLGHLSAFHQAKAAWQAGRSSGDHNKAEQMYRLMSYSRLAAAIIQHDFPQAKGIADIIAKAKAAQAVKARAATGAEA